MFALFDEFIGSIFQVPGPLSQAEAEEKEAKEAERRKELNRKKKERQKVCSLSCVEIS